MFVKCSHKTMDPRLPIPILIKDEEKFSDVPEVIDLDEQVSSEDIILEWCTRVRLKFKSYFNADTERNLDTLMKWYIQFFMEEAINIDDCLALKAAVTKHIQFFKVIFSELDCHFVDNYLDNMEDILALYCNLEATSLPKKKSDSAYGSTLKAIGRKLIATFNAFLMCREERVLHVLMKMKLNSSEESTDLLNFLYGELVTKKPANKSDLAFCRAYILYQKWKMIQKPDLWQTMDSTMYEQFDRTPNSLKTNETLKQILFPQNESVLNVLTHISNNYTMMSEEYFKFLRSQNIQEDSIVSLDVINVDIDEQPLFDEDRDGEQEDIDRAYNDYVESMANITITCDPSPANQNNGNEQPASKESDDECVIVGVGTIDFGQSNSDLICEISDDEDIIDIIFFEPKQENSKENEKEKVKCSESPVSFFDSIDISDTPTDVIPPSPPSSPIIFVPVAPPSEELIEINSPKESDVTSDSTVHEILKRKPKQTRKLKRKPKELPKELMRRKMMAEKRRKMMLKKKRRQQIAKDKENNNRNKEESSDRQVEPPKNNVNHIETQTDFQLAEPEDIFRPPYMITPPSEHQEDRQDDIVTKQDNVYASILPNASTSCNSETELQHDQSTEEEESVEQLEKSVEQLEKSVEQLEEVVAQENEDSEEEPESSKDLSNEKDVSAEPSEIIDNVPDNFPSSSNISSISSSKRGTDYYSSPTSPDVSSTSHDNDAKTSSTEHLSDIADTEATENRVDSPKKCLPSKKLTCRDFDRFQEQMNANKKCGLVHSKWGTLIKSHGLEDIFPTGEVTKVNGTNGCMNPYENEDFDLFGNQTPPPIDPQAERMANTPNDSSKTSSSGIPSPGYEGICDFETYLSRYKEQNGGSSPPKAVEPFKTPKFIAGRRVDEVESKPKGKRKSLAFAAVEDLVETAQPHTPQAIPTSAVQGILKNRPAPQTIRRTTRPKIPRRLINLHSLKQYGVKPNDPYLQADPIVVMKTISESEMAWWKTTSEISRKVRLQRMRTQFNMVSTSLCRVDYDKSTMAINANDRVQFNKEPEAMRHWRASEGELTASRLEGRLHSESRDTFDGDRDIAECENSSCCDSLAADIANLIVSGKHNSCSTESRQLLPKPNPFALATPSKLVDIKFECNSESVETNKTPTEENICTNTVELENINCTNIRLPAVVPELEDFEKTLRMEEIAKNMIPSDLNNLTLRKFSPSPVINYCFSPQSNSPSHTFLSECYPFEKLPLFQDGDNFDVENNFQDNIGSCQAVSSALSESSSVVDNFKIPPDNIFQENSMESLKYSDIDYKTEDYQIRPNEQESEEIDKTENRESLEEEPKVRLPLKKRKLSVANSKYNESEDELLGPDLVEEIIKRARAERLDDGEDISYPAKPAISIAEIQEKLEPLPRPFKTPAEKKEMPPAALPRNFLEQPKIVTEQYNNHTYNNPTINYHMNNVPYPFFPCGSLSYFPPILLPVNSTTTFDVNLMNQQQQTQQQAPQEIIGRPRREKKNKRKKKE